MSAASLYVFAYLLMNLTQQTMWYCAFSRLFPAKLPPRFYYPLVLALNMMDEVRANGGTIMVNELEELLGVPVVPISAAKNEGIDELVGGISCVSFWPYWASFLLWCLRSLPLFFWRQWPPHRSRTEISVTWN